MFVNLRNYKELKNYKDRYRHVIKSNQICLLFYYGKKCK